MSGLVPVFFYIKFNDLSIKYESPRALLDVYIYCLSLTHILHLTCTHASYVATDTKLKLEGFGSFIA